ncbi:thioredoxin family protein [Bacillus massiliigorillae]|uniref:thioredoxin family protein n=1 Tax=Bacillus massiliigorillae TaxID=1243664 RepID=UPI0003A168E9|nr:thioredoxin family protein [Bacillus massiliigorillae]
MEKITSLEQLQEVANLPGLQIVFIKTNNCGVCEAVLYRLQQELTEAQLEHLYLVQSEESKEIVGQYLLYAAPTILFFNEGKEIHRESRFVSFENIHRLLTTFEEE